MFRHQTHKVRTFFFPRWFMVIKDEILRLWVSNKLDIISRKSLIILGRPSSAFKACEETHDTLAVRLQYKIEKSRTERFRWDLHLHPNVLAFFETNIHLTMLSSKTRRSPAALLTCLRKILGQPSSTLTMIFRFGCGFSLRLWFSVLAVIFRFGFDFPLWLWFYC